MEEEKATITVTNWQSSDKEIFIFKIFVYRHSQVGFKTQPVVVLCSSYLHYKL